MTEINGFKVVGPTELVIGKVVEFKDNSDDNNLRMVEYYINEYNTYLNRTIVEFHINPADKHEQKMNEFKKVLGNFIRIIDVYVEEKVMNILL